MGCYTLIAFWLAVCTGVADWRVALVLMLGVAAVAFAESRNKPS